MLSARSRGLVGAADLALMKPAARLINTSRGPIVDEAALIAALRARRIAGAAIDVFDEEPLPPAHPFRSMDNVLATPHIGYVSENTYRTFYGHTVAAVRAFLDGEPIPRAAAAGLIADFLRPVATQKKRRAPVALADAKRRRRCYSWGPAIEHR